MKRAIQLKNHIIILNLVQYAKRSTAEEILYYETKEADLDFSKFLNILNT